MSLEQIYFFIKLLASLLVIGSMAGFGFYESMRLTQRLRLLKELYRMVMLLGSEIKYTALPVPEAVSRIGGRTEGAVKTFLDGVAAQLYLQSGDSLAKVWRTQAQICFEDSPLMAEDMRLIKEIGDNLGYGDRQTQVGAVGLCMENFRMSIQRLEKNVPAKKRLYQCIGWGGIFADSQFDF